MQNVGAKPTIAIPTRTYSKIVVTTIFNKHEFFLKGSN
jgi:hypothetical protein